VKRILLTIVITIALAGSYSAQSQATIEGVVLDAASSQPIAGVRITLSPATTPPPNPFEFRPPPPEATSDSQGHFSLETRDVGRLRVVPTRDGYVDPPPGVWVQVSVGERIQSLELRMSRPAVIRGRVLTAEGQPIVGTSGSASLMRYSYYGADGKRMLVSALSGPIQRMNDKGEFRFYDVPPGEYYLVTSGGGFVVGGSYQLFYPGVVDEAKATPIRVARGEDLQLPPLVWPPREKGSEVILRVNGAPDTAFTQIYVGDVMLGTGLTPNPPEIKLRAAPGHYDAVVTMNVIGNQEVRYAFVPIDVGNADLQQEVVLKRGAAVTTQLLLEDEAGQRSAAPPSLRCSLRAYGLSNCNGSQVVPGVQEVRLDGLPADAFVQSAKAGDHDILAEGLNVTGDTKLEIILATPGAIVQGRVRDAGGATVPAASVALVPNAPYRATALLYRSVIADPSGKFEIHGVAPGSYKLFAWPEVEGTAYRNAHFMKEYEERGKPVKIEKRDRVSIDLVSF